MSINPFARTAPTPEVGGTDRLRTMLKARSRKWSLATVARDINDNIADAHKRAAARDIASRMGGGSDVTAGIVRNLVNNMPESVGREAGLTADRLEDFMNGKADLSATAKTALAGMVFTGNVRYDETSDRLVDVPLPSKPFGHIRAVPYVNPDPAIAAAQAALADAIKAASPPVRTAPMPTGKGNQEPGSLRRPGFA
jgi:hypothetical protein